MKEPNYKNQDSDPAGTDSKSPSGEPGESMKGHDDEAEQVDEDPEPEGSDGKHERHEGESAESDEGGPKESDEEESAGGDEEGRAENHEQEYDGPVVSIKGLRKSFKGHEVLKGVDLHVNKGENLVVLGKSGSGKSVLIKCLVKLEWPDAGEIKVFGKDIATLDYRELNEMRLKIGFLFQNGALYDSMTVRENLAFPLKQHRKKMPRDKKTALIMEMLDDVGLSDAIDQMPSKLSGGQNKRIGLARTLILRPELMLYDEPTTGLDTGTAKEISDLMVRTKNKYKNSSITITHDMACARITADRIVMMKEGVVVAEGSYDELEKSDDEWIRSFFH